MGLQRRAIIIDPIQHDRKHREDHAWRCVLASRQDMMNHAFVYTSVAVLERVNVDKIKCGSCRLQDARLSREVCRMKFVNGIMGRRK